MRAIVIIPAFNEGKKIYETVTAVRQEGYEVVVVDDGSTDNTAAAAALSGAIVLRHFINRGYGAAVTTGNQWAAKHAYDAVVHFDADGQHAAGEIKKMLAPILAGEVEVTMGSRFLSSDNKTMPCLRKLLLKIATIFTFLLSGIKVTDAHNGFRALTVAALAKIDCRQDGMSYCSEIVEQVAKQKLTWREVPTTVVYSDYALYKGGGNTKKILLGIKFLWGRAIK